MASKLAGGKAEQGALLAAMEYVYNHCMSGQQCWEQAQEQVGKVFVAAGEAWFRTSAGVFGALVSVPVAPVAQPVMFGLRAFGLEETAAALGAKTLLNDPNWKATAIRVISDAESRILVSLDGLRGASTTEKVMSAVQQGASKSATPTNWELRQMYEAGRLRVVEFFSGGKPVPNPF